MAMVVTAGGDGDGNADEKYVHAKCERRTSSRQHQFAIILVT
jgi:hypothetical protein